MNATTNQLSGYTYDANGNLISTGYSYDVENRISFANAGGVQYFYDAQNKRVWQATCIPGYCTPGGTWILNTAMVNLFGADGKQLASYGPLPAWNNNTTNQVAIKFSPSAVRSYFGGKLVGQQLGLNIYEPVIQDRLGSVGKYYPYGEERNSPQLPNDQVKFATYTRDSATGNDYADQRYYTSVLGRFMTPDPHEASGGPSSPGSWNRYAYASSDPANNNDPTGLDAEGPPPDGCYINGDWIPICPVFQRSRPMPADPPPPTPQSIKKDIYKTYGKKINDCIKSVFGNDAAKIPTQTLANAPVLNFTKSSAQLANLYGAPDPGYRIVGESDPTLGQHGTIYVASYIYKALKDGDDGQLDLIDETYVHELGNLLDEILNPNTADPKYGRHYGDPSAADNDTGQQLENCVFN